MAQYVLTTTEAVLNTATTMVESTLESGTSTSGFQISGVKKCSKLGIYMEESSGTASVWSISPSDSYQSSGQGRLDITLTSTEPRLITVEGARLMQTDGTIDIHNGTSSADVNQTHSTGIITVFQMPDG